MWGMKLNFLSKMTPNKFILVNHRDLHPIQLKDRIIVKTPKLTKMHTLGFGLGQFKAVLHGPLLNFIETLLKLTFDSMDMFRCNRSKSRQHIGNNQHLGSTP